MKRRLVISAVNFTEGGPLTVLRDCLQAAQKVLADDWEIIALVHNADLVGIHGIRYIEFPTAKKSWIHRLAHEFWKFHGLSKELKSDLWLSLHDISPRVVAKRQVVYCHNPAPFYRPSLRESWWEPSFFLFCLFYKYAYRINIKSNTYVIVQQAWIRQAFEEMFGLKNIVVAHPVSSHSLPPPLESTSNTSTQSGKTVFLYPALPRVFKNFEVACDAARLLHNQGREDFELRLTVSEKENPYAAHLKQRYGQVPAIRFIGRQSREEMAMQYQQAAAIIFPSRLETWGLPITETKANNKPLLLADLPYAHETLASYGKACFFNPLDAHALAGLMKEFMQNRISFQTHPAIPVTPPYAPDWNNLLRLITATPYLEKSEC